MAKTNFAAQVEVEILARLLGNGERVLPSTIARYVLGLHFGEHDKARMHDLTVRNQEDGLSQVEKNELMAYSKAGTILSILKSKARRSVQGKSRKRAAS